MTGMNAAYLDEVALRTLGFAQLGENVRIHETAVLANCANISIGSNVRIDAFTVVSAGKAIIIGSHVHIGTHCSFVGSDVIEIGDFCGVSHGTRIFSASDDYTGLALTGPTVPMNYRLVESGPVRLGRHAIIGSNCVILPDITIGEGAAIGALSLVTKSVPDWMIYTGTPAKPLKPRDKALLAKEAMFLGGNR